MLPFAKFDGEALFQGRLYFPKSRKSSRNVNIISFGFMLPFAESDGEALFQGRLYFPKSRKVAGISKSCLCYISMKIA